MPLSRDLQENNLMLLVMGNTNTSLILLLGKLYLDNPKKGKAKNYPLQVNKGKNLNVQ